MTHHSLPVKERWPRCCWIIEAAIAAGTHGETFLTVCDGCGQWVSSIYFVDPGSHKRFCPPCSDRLGQGPRTYALRVERMRKHILAQREQYA